MPLSARSREWFPEIASLTLLMVGGTVVAVDHERSTLRDAAGQLIYISIICLSAALTYRALQKRASRRRAPTQNEE